MSANPNASRRRPAEKKRWPGFPGPRNSESIGEGFFVFRRGDRSGRIENRGIPFEHPTLDKAVAEAKRLREVHGGKYDVVGVFASLGDLGAP